MKKLMLMLGVATCLFVASCSNDHQNGPRYDLLPNDVILQWNEAAYLAFGGVQYQHSLMASRINAMTHLAMHDAVNAAYPVFSTYAYTGKEPGANPVAAAASAAHTVLMHELPEKGQFLDSVLTSSLSKVPDDESKTRGIQLGMAVGAAIIYNRADDGSAGAPTSPVPPSDTPGEYQAVPPFDFVFAPNWVSVKPFGLQKIDQFRSAPHPSLDSEEYAEAFNEVKLLGKLNGAARTDDQTTFSHFWYEFSEAGWNRVASVIAKSKNLDLFQTARLFALVDMAMADAYIAGWDSKFHYNLWRPYTAIRRADIDQNDKTVEDTAWEPLLPTPPVQDYPSTHSALGNAAAMAITKILGNETSFKMSSPTSLPGGGERSFTNVMQAADENADSRVIAGIHFRFACNAGQKMGNEVGEWIADRYLTPLE